MKYIQKEFTYLIIFIISFVFIQTDLLSQDKSPVNQDTLLIGGIYKFKLINGEELSGELQDYDSLSIRLLHNENIINLKREQIKSIEIPQKDFTRNSSLNNSLNWHPYFSVSVIGGGIIPVGDFAETYSFSGSIGANINYHFLPLWAVYINITNNFLSYKSTDEYYYSYYNYPDKSSSYFELTVGPRYYFTQEKVKGFCEAGMGLYNFDARYSSHSKASFGFNFGAGANIKLSRDVDLVIKTRYHYIIKYAWMTILSDNYFGIYTGVNYIF